jgi:hypothetical protein
MTNLAVTVPDRVLCPSWCVNDRGGEHSHVSRERHVEGVARPLSAKLVQVPDDDEPRMLVNGCVATLDQAEAFAYALLRLGSEATLAEPGLGFVEALAEKAGISIEEMALASGMDATRLRAQREGEQVLTVHEFDQLALAVAQLTVAAAG